eukprot:6202681-Prymnesium_polylepis.1
MSAPAKTDPAELTAEIKRQIHQHLSDNNVFTDLKRIVSGVLGTEPSSDAALDATTQSAMIAQLVGTAGPAVSAPDPQRNHLH